jgi:streptomycin 6-kinase
MGQEELEIEIDASGKVTVRTKGIKGEACLDYADLFVQLLGREESRQLTHEYYEEAEVKSRLQQKLKR